MKSEKEPENECARDAKDEQTKKSIAFVVLNTNARLFQLLMKIKHRDKDEDRAEKRVLCMHGEDNEWPSPSE